MKSYKELLRIFAQQTEETEQPESHKIICELCEKEITNPNDERDLNGRTVCSGCYICPNCSFSFDEEDPLTEERRYGNAPKNPKHGCSNCMAICAGCRRVTNLKEEMHAEPAVRNPDYFCEDCFYEYYGYCDECHECVPTENMCYTDGASLCQYCFEESYGYCNECNEAISKQELHEGDDGEMYCETCTPPSASVSEHYTDVVKIQQTEFNKFNRVLTELKRLLPISPKELRQKNPRLAALCRDLIAFAGGKQLTPELVASFESDMPKEKYPVDYTVWRSPLQRSVKSKTPQLVINILASEQLLAKMQEDGTYDLFDKINQTSKESTHPYVKDQLGWIRVELNPEEKYILVDEVQTDHMNAIDRIRSETYQGKSYAEYIMQSKGFTPEQFESYLAKFKNHIRDFYDIAMDTIGQFAKANGYEKIFYHTYESGKALKHNAPPASIYTDLPAKHFFAPTEETPFGLQGEFLIRNAKLINLCNLFYKLAYS